MTFGSDDRPSPIRRVKSAKVIEVVKTGFGRFDLRTPPTRAEVGMADDGATDAIYESRPQDAFEVEVLLPDEQVLRFESDLTVFSRGGGKFPSTQAPDGATIKRGLLSVEEARDRLLALAEQFDLEVEPIDDWYRIASSGRVPSNDAQPNTPFLSTKLGYLTLSVQGRYSPTADDAVVAISLFWGGAALRDRTPAPVETD
ncbi:MAG: hypothetical protein ACT4P1_00145 [Sporichthyaceae bacterium]